jgi:hypothetical protein
MNETRKLEIKLDVIKRSLALEGIVIIQCPDCVDGKWYRQVDVDDFIPAGDCETCGGRGEIDLREYY